MSSNVNPNPQDILAAIKREEIQRNQGRLKIFLGMAAGVGKTYAMLDEALNLKKEEIDIVIGNIESHGREETEKLLINLPQVPKKICRYKNAEFEELDVEAIINLHPSFVLIDELAHSNIPGEKHAKRWQDVLEILDNGINVHTTLNIQHIESLNDKVRDITEIVVKETVPDMIIQKAHSIQLVDLTIDELLLRLEEGKVYTGGLSEIAAQNFFQRSKLTALREIALRYVADKIDIDLRRMVKRDGRIEWNTREKFLVAINESEETQKLIRATHRLSLEANAPWAAVYVNTGRTLNVADQEQLTKNMTLISGLGAETVTIDDHDIAEGIKRVAFQRGITQLVLGRPNINLMLSLVRGASLLDKLAVECKNMDLHVIRHEKYALKAKKACFSFLSDHRFTDYIHALLLFGFIASFYFMFLGKVTKDALLMSFYLLAAILIAILTWKKLKQKKILVKSHEKAFKIQEIFQYFDSNMEREKLLPSLEEHLPKVLNGSYKIVIKNKMNTLDLDNVLLDEKERMTANWAFDNGQEAGFSTETLSLAENLYIPLKAAYTTLGLLIYKPPHDQPLSAEDREIIHSLCEQLAISLEKLLP